MWSSLFLHLCFAAALVSEVLFGLKQAPTPVGRTIAPMTWESANFAAFQTRGERHLRHLEFANATATRLNLGAFHWTVECWVALDSR
jgi:hypothetical protein